MTDLKFAAVDLGAESGRVLVGLFDGERVRLEEAHRFANVSVQVPGTLHWDTLRLWHDIGEGLSRAAASHGPHLDGVGVDTWGVDFALLDSADQLLGNPVHYRDSRTDGIMEAAFEIVPRREIFESTGLQFMQLNSLFQLLALKRANSPQFAAARCLLFTPDLFNFWLTGRKACEYTIASTSQMLDARTRDWNRGLLERLGLPEALLPEIVDPGTELGTVRPEVAARLGLGADTPVMAVGSHDTASAVAAVPARGGASSQQNWAYLSSGTWSLMGVEVPQPLIDDRAARLNFTNEGGVGGQIRCLKNIAGLWLVQECRRAWRRAGRELSYDQLTDLAAGAAAGQPLIDPDHPSLTAPDDMPRALAQLCRQTGQAAPDGEGAYIRCCLNSLAHKYRWTLESLESLRGHRIETLHIVGGGTQNRLLCRLTADCLGRPVIAGPVEATAVGNILVQAMTRGHIKDLQELRGVVAHSFVLDEYEPDPGAKAQWDNSHERFLNLWNA